MVRSPNFTFFYITIIALSLILILYHFRCFHLSLDIIKYNFESFPKGELKFKVPKNETLKYLSKSYTAKKPSQGDLHIAYKKHAMQDKMCCMNTQLHEQHASTHVQALHYYLIKKKKKQVSFPPPPNQCNN